GRLEIEEEVPEPVGPRDLLRLYGGLVAGKGGPVRVEVEVRGVRSLEIPGARLLDPQDGSLLPVHVADPAADPQLIGSATQSPERLSGYGDGVAGQGRRERLRGLQVPAHAGEHQAQCGTGASHFLLEPSDSPRAPGGHSHSVEDPGLHVEGPRALLASHRSQNPDRSAGWKAACNLPGAEDRCAARVVDEISARGGLRSRTDPP